MIVCFVVALIQGVRTYANMLTLKYFASSVIQLTLMFAFLP